MAASAPQWRSASGKCVSWEFARNSLQSALPLSCMLSHAASKCVQRPVPRNYSRPSLLPELPATKKH